MSMDTKKPDQSTIEKLLEESDGVEVDMLNSESLKVLLLGFEKKINKNQKLRMKYPQDPEKFMDSEVELHEELNNLYAISASPELYPSFVQSGSVQVCVSLSLCLCLVLCVFVLLSMHMCVPLCRPCHDSFCV